MTPLEQSTLIYQHWMINLGVIQTIAFFLAAIIAGWVGYKQTQISKRQTEISADLLKMQSNTTELTAVSALLSSIHNQLRYPNIHHASQQNLQSAVGHYHNQLYEVLKSIGR